jgi:hypothetical protein
MKTTTWKGRDGFEAETVIDLGFDRRQLRIHTGKRSRGLQCTAHVVQVSEDGKSFTMVLFQDFNQIVVPVEKKRCTERAINDMHEKALMHVDTIIADAKLHYKQAP